MAMKQIRPDFWVISAVDQSLRVFMSDSYTDSGMMFNTYLAEAEDGAVLFGAPPARQMEEWLQLIEGHICGKKRLTFVSFCDRNDLLAVKLLADKCPELTVIGSAAALYALEGCEAAFRGICVRGRRVLELGGRTWTFEVETAGNLCVFCKDWKTVLSGSAFGAYCAYPEIFLSGVSERDSYWSGAQNYRRDHAGVKQSARCCELIRAAEEMGAELLCPAQGPIVDTDLEKLFSLYTGCREDGNGQLRIALIYEPGQYVQELAEKIAEGITESGEIHVELLDLSEVNRDTVLEKAACADALIFGTPEVKGRAAKSVYDVVTSLTPQLCKEKLVSVFWAANSKACERDSLNSLLKALELDMSSSEFFCPGKPDESMLNAAFEQGFAFGCSLQRIPNPRKPKLVKCLVCGEIFDASLGGCPVCGVGLEQCVPVEEDAVVFRCDTDRNYLILGGGIAAVSAAEAIRRRDKTGTIRMVSAEDVLPINRPMLTKDLKAVLAQPETLSVHDAQWYADLDIQLILGQTVTALDPAGRCVSLENGETLSYDKLIYALGGECFIPLFQGREKRGVIAIRHLSDMAELAGMLKNASNAVVIGGGVLGLEAASELHRFGLHVTVLESAPQIVGRQIDETNAAVLRASMDRMGVPCFEGVSIEEITGDGQANGVRLADGRWFPAEVVVVSCGIRSSIQLAQAAGVTVDRSVIVNERMETNLPEIYACGDCAALNGVNFQLWQEASQQGRVAGANAAGECVSYTNQVFGCSLEAFGVSLFAIGDVGKKEGVPYRKVEWKDDVRGKRETYWFMGESLTGAILFNSPEKTDSVSAAVVTRARYDELF